jgi:uncharacterized membrane protein (UPF0182 family)
LLGAIRPDEVNVPLLLHVLGAMLLVGTLLTVVIAIVLGWRRANAAEAQALTRFGLRTMLLGVLPSWILMRVGAQWTESEENLPEEIEESTWIGIGYMSADIGLLLLLVAIVLSAVGLRRLRAGTGVGMGRAAGIIATVLLAADLVAVWAMAAKPD